jgi:hypothetical protein
MPSQPETALKQRFFATRGDFERTAGEWAVLSDKAYVAEALQDYDHVEEQLQHLLEALSSLHRTARLLSGGSQPLGRQVVDLRLRLDAAEARRTRTFERALATSAGVEQPRVIAFREAVLGGRLLTREQARAFVSSPAAQALPRATFEAEGIPFLDHVAHYREAAATPDGAAWQVMVEVDPPGAVYSVSSGQIEESGAGATAFSTAVLREHGGRQEAQVLPGSLLDDLRELAGWLGVRYPWKETDAAWFVLTGLPPRVEPLKCRADIRRHRHYSRATITLEVEPWVSGETVERAYRFCQQQLLKGPERAGDNRKVSDKSLAVFDFVVEQIDDRGQVPSWPKLLAIWNRTHSADWQFDRADHLRQAFFRAKARVLHPSINAHVQDQFES